MKILERNAYTKKATMKMVCSGCKSVLEAQSDEPEIIWKDTFELDGVAAHGKDFKYVCPVCGRKNFEDLDHVGEPFDLLSYEEEAD